MLPQIEGAGGRQGGLWERERRDAPFGHDLMPEGSVEEAGKDGGSGQTAQPWEWRGQCLLKLSTPLRRQQGRTVINLAANLNNLRWMV